MKLTHTPRPRRGAFTLVELMVVIAIIAVLVALLSAAVFRILRKGPEVQVRNDISQLSTSVQSFQTAFKVNYIPSRIRLREDLNYQLNNQYEADSLQYLQMLWPRLAGSAHTGGVGVDWNGDGQVTPGAFWDLEGDQCLVFFLGGIPALNPAGALGFSTDAADPSLAPSPGAPRKGPYFDAFQSSRLLVRNPSGAALFTFYSYTDPYDRPASATVPAKQVYAYFSSYKGQNGYNRYGTSDCLSLGVSPYMEGASRFYNPNGFQIVCAGLDGVFGRGSLPAFNGGTAAIWTPTGASTSPAILVVNGTQPTGSDDMANFYDSLMGTNR
jgi:prepilin-type N-terminal cleavage/methylation domain-containing protein